MKYKWKCCRTWPQICKWIYTVCVIPHANIFIQLHLVTYFHSSFPYFSTCTPYFPPSFLNDRYDILKDPYMIISRWKEKEKRKKEKKRYCFSSFVLNLSEFLWTSFDNVLKLLYRFYCNDVEIMIMLIIEYFPPPPL